MYNPYFLYTIQKKKSDIIGLWKDKNGKIYKDFIKIKKFYYFRPFYKNVIKLFLQGEKTVFYINNDKATIETREGNKTFLNNVTFYHTLKLKASLVKKLLKNNGGLTIFKNKGFKNGYTLQTWEA